MLKLILCNVSNWLDIYMDKRVERFNGNMRLDMKQLLETEVWQLIFLPVHLNHNIFYIIQKLLCSSWWPFALFPSSTHTAKSAFLFAIHPFSIASATAEENQGTPSFLRLLLSSRLLILFHSLSFWYYKN